MIATLFTTTIYYTRLLINMSLCTPNHFYYNSIRPEEIMLFRFFKVFPNADAFEFCFYILKAGLLY